MTCFIRMKYTSLVWIEPGGGHPGRDDGGRTGAAGARPREVAFRPYHKYRQHTTRFMGTKARPDLLSR